MWDSCISIPQLKQGLLKQGRHGSKQERRAFLLSLQHCIAVWIGKKWEKKKRSKLE